MSPAIRSELWTLAIIMTGALLVGLNGYTITNREVAESGLRKCLGNLAATKIDARDRIEGYGITALDANETADWCIERLETCEALHDLDEAIDRFEEEAAADG